ncbi:MAG: hypothetical protein RIS43_65 [Actinomycetota bacterium]
MQEVPTPTILDGDLLIRTQSIGVNFIDCYQREGIYPVALPFVPGREGVGVVEAVGSGVDDIAVGDVVAWPFADGGYAEYVKVPAQRVVKVPAGISADDACALMLQGMTAHYLVNSTYAVRSGDVILVHAAAGGVGQLLTRLVKLKGATVIGTVSSGAKAQIATDAGVDHIIRYDKEDVANRVREIAPGGVHVVYDGVGKTTFDASLASLRHRGMMVLFGGSSGQVPAFDLQRLNAAGSLFITRPSLGHYIATTDELRWRGSELFALHMEGKLPVQIGARFALADASLAHSALESRQTTGKVVLSV